MLTTLVLFNRLYVEIKQSKIDKKFIYFKTFERAVFAKPAFFAKCASLLCQFDSIFFANYRIYFAQTYVKFCPSPSSSKNITFKPVFKVVFTRRNFSIEPKFLLFKFKRFLFSFIWVLVRQKKISIRSKNFASWKTAFSAKHKALKWKNIASCKIHIFRPPFAEKWKNSSFSQHSSR